MLVERLSGEDYYDYVRRHVYAPAGMTRTAAYAVDSLPPNTALGYTTRGEGEQAVAAHPNTETLPGRGSSAGGGYSTAGDLLRFLQALREGKVRGAPGLNADLEGDLPGGYDLVVLANLDPPAAERIGRAVRAWLGAAD
jgi:CubicO group peptidase (beta-lactamase class C family)